MRGGTLASFNTWITPIVDPTNTKANNKRNDHFSNRCFEYALVLADVPLFEPDRRLCWLVSSDWGLLVESFIERLSIEFFDLSASQNDPFVLCVM